MSAPTIAPGRTSELRDCGRCGKAMTSGGARQPGVPVHSRRGLCEGCEVAARRDGTLLDHPALVRTRAEVLEDYELLRTDGATRRQAAARMGMTVDALDRALQRARAAGLDVVMGPK